MKLNIYNKKKIVKTYEARPTDIEFGVLEDIAEKFNLDELEGVSRQDINLHILKGGLSLIGTIRDVMLDTFDGLTAEELKHAHIIEMRGVVVELIQYLFGELAKGANEEKN